MKKMLCFFNCLLLFVIIIAIPGCRRNRNDVWEDTKTASRHMHRGVSSLAGKHGDSRAVRSREEFYPYQEAYASETSPADYELLPDYQDLNEVAMADFVAPQPKYTPGDPGSPIPGIDAFQDPSSNSQLARIFKPISFEYNSSLVKGQDSMDTIKNISEYMGASPETYIFVEGHCDERGPEAFNLALGSRRSNAVRNLLITDGVNPDRIFTVSYGKERPLVLEHHEEAWAQNRRAEFKIYQR